MSDDSSPRADLEPAPADRETALAAIRTVQAMFAGVRHIGVSASDELIAERRAEARRELAS